MSEQPGQALIVVPSEGGIDGAALIHVEGGEMEISQFVNELRIANGRVDVHRVGFMSLDEARDSYGYLLPTDEQVAAATARTAEARAAAAAALAEMFDGPQARPEQYEQIVAYVDQRALFDDDGAWIAHLEQARREVEESYAMSLIALEVRDRATAFIDQRLLEARSEQPSGEADL